MGFYTNVGPESGPILCRDGLAAIDVLPAPDAPAPVGTAFRTGRTEGGLITWRITIRGAELSGDWIVLGREFLARQRTRSARGLATGGDGESARPPRPGGPGGPGLP